jgi:hypothetical protein
MDASSSSGIAGRTLHGDRCKLKFSLAIVGSRVMYMFTLRSLARMLGR